MDGSFGVVTVCQWVNRRNGII